MNNHIPIITVAITNDSYLIDKFHNHFASQLQLFRTLSHTNSVLDCLLQIHWQDIELLIIDVSSHDLQSSKLIKRIKRFNHAIKCIALVDDEDKLLQCQLINSSLDAVILRSQMMFLLPQVITVVRLHYACLPNNGNIRTRKITPTALTRREKEVLSLVQEQMSNDEIAQTLSISSKTVSVHRFHIATKLKMEESIKLIERSKKFNVEHI